jgi:hypothetical protein
MFIIYDKMPGDTAKLSEKRRVKDSLSTTWHTSGHFLSFTKSDGLQYRFSKVKDLSTS